MKPEERAREGVFLAFQYPVEIPGVSNVYFLKNAVNAIRKHRGQPELDAIDFLQLTREKAQLVQIDEELDQAPRQRGILGRREEAQRDLPDGGPRAGARDPGRDGFGPRHRRPADRGLGRQRAARSPERSMIVVTHYQRLLNYIVPDFLHVLVEGQIVRSGGKELALELEERGYAWLEKEPAPARRRQRRPWKPSPKRRGSPRTLDRGGDRSGEPAWLAARRRAARERFEKLGFPTPKIEEWRYTSVGPIVDTPWRHDRDAAGPAVRLEGPAAGVRVLSLAQALERGAGARSKRASARSRAPNRTPSPLLNTGARSPTTPSSSSSAAPSSRARSRSATRRPTRRAPPCSYPRCLVLAGDGSQASVVERFAGRRNATSGTPSPRSLLGDGAVLDARQAPAGGPARSDTSTRSRSRQARGFPLRLAQHRARVARSRAPTSGSASKAKARSAS